MNDRKHEQQQHNNNNKSMKKNKKKKHHHNKYEEEIQRTDPDAVAVAAEDEEEELRQKVILRRAQKKMAKRLAKLGLDENGEPLDNFSLTKYPVREWKIKLPGSNALLAFNPVVTILGIAFLWTFIALCTASKSLSDMRMEWKDRLGTQFTWAILGSKAVLFFFMLYITYRYGHVHLGQATDKPQFSSLTYFCMIFAACAGPRLFWYNVTEPMFHQYSNFFVNPGYRSQDEISMFAINLTLHHWGITTWLHFALVAVAMAVAGHCFNLPMTFRACFYPIFGAYTWGWIGDMIDSTAIACAMLCVCAELSATTSQITTGLLYLGWLNETSTEQEISSIQNTIIWLITVASTASVISGIGGGIRLMSVAAMAFVTLLMFLVFIMDDTKFLLNLQVQEIGYFFQYNILQLNFWTDAFGQLKQGSGRAVDMKAADQDWIRVWTTIYQSYVIALSSAIGVFIAHISRGRKIWEVVTYTLAAPIGYSLVWFCIWGGVGLRQFRQAMEMIGLGELLYNSSEYFLVDGSSICYDVPQEDIVVGDTVVFSNVLPGVTPVCLLDQAKHNEAVFNVLHSFRFPESISGDTGFGPSLSLFLIICAAMLFIASSDSTIFIVDSLASNSRKNLHWSRRMFWGGMTGLQATAVLAVAGEHAEMVITPIILICALPLVLAMCYVAQSVVLLCRAADDAELVVDANTEYHFPSQPVFHTPVYGGIFNAMESLFSLGLSNAARVEMGMHRPTTWHILEFGQGLVLPFLPLSRALRMLYPQCTRLNTMCVFCYSLCYVGWVCLAFATLSRPGLRGMACTLFVICGSVLAVIRSEFRSKYNIRSNGVADLVGSMFFWPQVLMQMASHWDHPFVDAAKCNGNNNPDQRREGGEEMNDSGECIDL